MTATAAAIGLPFYLGFIHTPVPQLVFYSGVAGAAMASGEFAEQASLERGGFRLFMADTALWVAIIVLLGGSAYLLALLF